MLREPGPQGDQSDRLEGGDGGVEVFARCARVSRLPGSAAGAFAQVGHLVGGIDQLGGLLEVTLGLLVRGQ